MPRKDNASGCGCYSEPDAYSIAANATHVFKARRHRGIKVEQLLPAGESWVRFGFGCDSETGDDEQLSLKVSRLLGPDYTEAWSSVAWTSQETPYAGQTLLQTPRSFRIELELCRGEEVVSTAVVPILVASPRFTKSGFDWDVLCRVYCRLECGEAFVEVHLEPSVPIGFLPQGDFTSKGVRHYFAPVTAGEWGEGSFVQSDKAISGTVYAINTLGQVESGLPQDAGGYCSPTGPAIDTLPFVQMNECEIRSGDRHVPDAVAGSQFTRLELAFFNEAGNYPLTLTNQADGTSLANNTFFYEGQLAAQDAFGNPLDFDVEAAAAFAVFPGRPCGTKYSFGDPFAHGNFSVRLTVAVRFDKSYFFFWTHDLLTLDATDGSSPGVAPSLSITSCFGSGAAGIVTGPQDGDQPSPITGVKLTAGGSGYAVLGRVEPEVTVSGTTGTGSGGTFTVTLAESTDKCGLPTWGVSKVELAGGSGYEVGDGIVFAAGENTVTLTGAVATIVEPRAQPTLEASGSGTGADLEIAYDGPTGSPPVWSVASITVNDGGSGYSYDEAVVFGLGAGDVEQTAASAVIKTITAEPTLTATAAGGSGAELEIQYYSHPGGLAGWYGVESVTVIAGGTGYTNGSLLTFTLGTGDVLDPAYVGAVATIATDANGTITGVTRTNRGVYRKDTGEIATVEMQAGGEYYKATGDNISISEAGSYYEQDETISPHVADVQVSVVQTEAMSGSGAIITAVVDDNVGSDTFGHVVALEIDDGGQGYEVTPPQFASFEFLSGQPVTIPIPGQYGSVGPSGDFPWWRVYGPAGLAGTVYQQTWSTPFANGFTVRLKEEES